MDESSQNPYRAPDAAIADPADANGVPASRAERFAAAVVDTLLLLVVLVPVMFLGGYFSLAMSAGIEGRQLPLATQLLWGVISLVLFFLVQGYPLHASAQTWGKRLLKLQIVGLDGLRVPFARLIARRYLVLQGAGMVPFVGPLLSIGNVLLIFRADRRCGHDLIAGTRVIKLP